MLADIEKQPMRTVAESGREIQKHSLRVIVRNLQGIVAAVRGASQNLGLHCMRKSASCGKHGLARLGYSRPQSSAVMFFTSCQTQTRVKLVHVTKLFPTERSKVNGEETPGSVVR